VDADVYVTKVVEKVALCDNSDDLRISEILAQNVLYYCFLLQREQGIILFDVLLDLVGVQNPDILQVSLERVEQHMIPVSGTSRQNPPFTFDDVLMDAIEKQFYGKNSLYKLDQKLPHSDLTGEQVIQMINNFNSNNPARDIAKIFEQIFDLTVHPTAYREFFVIEGSNNDADKRTFFLAVMDDHSTLTQERYYRFLVQFINVVYDIDGSPQTLMICPSVTGETKDIINNCKGIYAMWDLSLVRLLHLLSELTDDTKLKIKEDISLLFAIPIRHSYSYMEGHVIANIEKYLHRSEMD
jgi:hypothetical protein